MLKESKSIEIGIYQASGCSPMLIDVKGRGRGAENAGGSLAPFQHPYCFELQCWHTFRVLRVEMHRNRHISSIPRVIMPIGVRGHHRGPEKAGGCRAPF